MGSDLARAWAEAAGASGSPVVVMGGRARWRPVGQTCQGDPGGTSRQGQGCPVHRAPLEVWSGGGAGEQAQLLPQQRDGPRGGAGTGVAEPWGRRCPTQQGTLRPQRGWLTGLRSEQAQWCCDQRL